MSALLGRMMQIVGMIILPIALYVGMGLNDVRSEVKLLAIGGAVYLIGWVLAKEKK